MSHTLALLVNVLTLIGAVGSFIFALSKIGKRLDKLLQTPARLEDLERSVHELDKIVKHHHPTDPGT